MKETRHSSGGCWSTRRPAKAGATACAAGAWRRGRRKPLPWREQRGKHLKARICLAPLPEQGRQRHVELTVRVERLQRLRFQRWLGVCLWVEKRPLGSAAGFFLPHGDGKAAHLRSSGRSRMRE